MRTFAVHPAAQGDRLCSLSAGPRLGGTNELLNSHSMNYDAVASLLGEIWLVAEVTAHMAIPDYETLMLPILKLASDQKDHTNAEIEQTLGSVPVLRW